MFRVGRVPWEQATTCVGTRPPQQVSPEGSPDLQLYRAPGLCSHGAVTRVPKKKMERSGRGEEILWRRDWEGKQRILTKQPVFCHICKLFIYRTVSNCWQLPRTGVALNPSRYKGLAVSKAEAGVCGGATGLHTYTCISIYVFCLSIIKWFRGEQEQGSQ